MAFADIRPSVVILQTGAFKKLNCQPIPYSHVSNETLSPWINLRLSKFTDTIAPSQVQGLTLGSDRYL